MELVVVGVSILILILLSRLVLSGPKGFNPAQDRARAHTASELPADPPPPQPDESRHFFLQVHGIYHRNTDGSSRQKIIRRCSPGESLAFVPEPLNPYDSNAIKICRLNGEQLGYMDATNAMRMTGDMSIGWTYRVNVEEIFETDRAGYLGCKIRIGVLTMSERTTARKSRSKKPI